MSKQKNTKRKNINQIIKCENQNMTKEQMIEIQSEAYYRALKRIETEKEKETNVEQKTYKWYETFFLFLNFCLFPWKMNKRFNIKNHAYDSIPIIFVGSVLYLCGATMWLSGLMGLLHQIGSMVMHGFSLKAISIALCLYAVMIFGSVFILSGKAFEKETDSNRIYAYSAIIIALFIVVISLLTLLGIGN